MRIPEGPEGTDAQGLPTLRTSQIRAYGAGGFTMFDGMESVTGCPRRFRLLYVEEREEFSEAGPWAEIRSYGSAIHEALYEMERNAIGPEEALKMVWPPSLPFERWREAVDDLNRYLERGGPMTKYATLGVEMDLFAKLYDDDEFGPIWFGGRLDWLGVDTEDASTLHLTDYKTNRAPPSKEQLRGDVQMMSYTWLVHRNWQQLTGSGSMPNVVSHLDAIKWFDREWRYSADDLEMWRSWAEAIARRILRDDSAKPVLNPGCAMCEVRWDCPVWTSLPTEGTSVLERKLPTTVHGLVRWMDEAKLTRRLLDGGISEARKVLEDKVRVEGSTIVDGTVWEMSPSFATEWDLIALHELLGLRFYEVVGTSKSAMARLGDRDLEEQALQLARRVPSGMSLTSRKATEEDEDG